jgi:hypothetical protein
LSKYLILPEILSVINLRESVFSRMLKSEGDYWVPETLVEQSKTWNEHGSGTQIGFVHSWASKHIEPLFGVDVIYFKTIL